MIFLVAPEHVPEDEFQDSASEIEVLNNDHLPERASKRAAESYVETYMDELDYPTEIAIHVLRRGRPFTESEVYDVIVHSVPEAEAKLRKKQET